MNVFNVTGTGSNAAGAATYTRASADSVVITTVSSNIQGLIFPADSAVSDEVLVLHLGGEDLSLKVYPSAGAYINRNQVYNNDYVTIGPGGSKLFRMITPTQWVTIG